MSRHPLLVLCLTTLSLLGAAPRASAGGFDVVNVVPARNAVGASTASTVVVVFSAAVDPASIDAGSVRVYGRWSGPVPGALSLNPAQTVLRFKPARPFFPGERVTVSLSSAVTDAGAVPLTGGHAWHFWCGSAAGPGSYVQDQVIPTKLDGEGFIQSYGLFAGDLDGDHRPDFAVPNEQADDVRVFMQDGCGTFGALAVYPVPSFSVPSSNEGQDYDGDGIVDFAVANISGDSLSVMRGVGDGTFEPAVTYASGNGARGLDVLDADGDGDVDIVLAHRNSSTMGLHRNQGDGSFAPVAVFQGGVSGETAVSAADADGDGHMDLFVAGYASDAIAVLLNDGTGSFTQTDREDTGANPWMTAVGDLDLDGDVDVVTCDSAGDTVTVGLGDGAGGLTIAGSLPLADFSLAIEVGDIDGDGDLDIVGSSYSGELWNVHVNDGSGAFPGGFTLPATDAGSCATIVDYDRDGFMDIVGVDELDDLLFLYRQDVSPAAGVQPAGCQATLRLDNLAASAGFGGRPPHDVAAGARLFTGVTAGPGEAFFLTGGVPLEPGVNSAFGLYHLTTAPILLASGTTNADGEGLLTFDIPASTPTGLDVALQVFVGAPGSFALTNPEVVRLVP